MEFKKIVCCSFIAAFAASSLAVAAEFKPASVRALGMGGSNVASTNGVDASYWNPAAYGFFDENSSSTEAKAVDNNSMGDKYFGLDVGVGLSVYLFGPIADNLNTLQGMQSPTGSPVAGLTAGEIVTMANFSDDLASLDPASGGVNVSADATLGARVSNYGLGVRTSLDVNVGVNFDNKNVGLAGDAVNAFTGGVGATVGLGSQASLGGYFTAVEQDSLRAQLVSAGYTADQAASMTVGYDAAMSADNVAASESAAMQAAFITLATASGDVKNNNPVVTTLGVALTEVGITYGYAMDDSLSFGGVLKYMQADMIAPTPESALGSTGTVSNAQGASGAESVTGFGLDLGVMYRLPDYQFGLTARNINASSFEHSSGYVYELKPQVKVGVAWIPSDTFTIEAAIDLTENEGAVASSLSQYWNIGLEWDAWNILALRVGAFKNMSEADIGLVPTIGLGLHLWAMRLDIGAAMSSNTVILDGNEFSTYATASAALAVDF